MGERHAWLRSLMLCVVCVCGACSRQSAWRVRGVRGVCGVVGWGGMWCACVLVSVYVVSQFAWCAWVWCVLVDRSCCCARPRANCALMRATKRSGLTLTNKNTEKSWISFLCVFVVEHKEEPHQAWPLSSSLFCPSFVCWLWRRVVKCPSLLSVPLQV